jgi:hypothetical protein
VTWKLIRVGKLALMVPVITSTDGRWVAMIRWMPAARAIWASRCTAHLDVLAGHHHQVGDLVDDHHQVGHVLGADFLALDRSAGRFVIEAGLDRPLEVLALLRSLPAPAHCRLAMPRTPILAIRR